MAAAGEGGGRLILCDSRLRGMWQVAGVQFSKKRKSFLMT